MTYAELVQKIRDYTETTATVLSSTIINDFISDAEFRIMTDVDMDVFRQNDYSTLTVGNPFVTLPTGILIIRYFTTYTDPGVRQVLLKKDISFMDEYSGNRVTQGVPKYYANWNETTAYIAPTPNSALNVELAYVKRPLAADGTAFNTGVSSSTTYMSLNAPNVLTYACLVEAFAFLQNDNMYKLYENKYQQSLTGLGVEQQGRRRRDEYMNGVIRETLNAPNTVTMTNNY